MSVNDGQQANETTFNNAFGSKTDDNTYVGKQTLNNSDTASGVQVTNVQREHNSIASYAGKAINALKDVLPTWVSTAVGLSTDNLTERAEALTVQVGTNISDIATNAADILLREETANKGSANGYAPLDATAKVPTANLPNSVVNARTFLGSWAASTNTPTLADGDTNQPGDEYAVSDNGTVDFGSGNITFTTGDTVIYDGSVWFKIEGSTIDSVNGQQGTVVLNANDINDVDTSGIGTGDYLRKSAGDFLAFDPDQIKNDTATGANATLSSVTDQAVVRLTDGALTSVDMIPAETKARRFILVNDTGGDVDINNLTGATSADQIITGTGLDLTLADQASLFLVYDLTETKWRVVGGSGSGGGANEFLSNLSSPVSFNQDLIPDTTNTKDIGSFSKHINTINANRLDFINGTRKLIMRASTLGLPSGDSTSTYIQAQGTDDLSISTTSQGSASTDSAPLVFETGNATGATSNSGDMPFRIGSATQNQGNFKFLKSGNPPIPGQVFTATNADGSGYWSEPTASAGLSLISGRDSNFDVDDLTWGTYADAAQAIPEDGAGGAANITALFTSVVGEVLNGDGSLEIAKDAANRQGQGAKVDKAVPIAFRGKSNRVSFNYHASAAFDFGTISTDSDVTVWAYDITNSKLLPLNFNRLTGEGRFESDIFIPSDCEDIRFILHIATTNASAWDLFIDDFKCELVPFTSFNNMSDWVDAGTLQVDATTSAPTKGTIVVDKVWYKYTGDTAQVRFEYKQSTAGTAGSGDYLFGGFPFEIDTDKIEEYQTVQAPGASLQRVTNSVGVFNGGIASSTQFGSVCVYDKDTVRLVGVSSDNSNSNSVGFVNSSYAALSGADVSYSATFEVPVKGRTSGAKHPAAVGLNAKQSMTIYKNGGSSTANVTIPSWTGKDKDSLNEFDLTTGVLTIKKPGDRYISFFCDSTSAGAFSAYIYVNGTIFARGVVGDGASGASGVARLIPDLKYGDEVTFRTNSAETFTADDTSNYISVFSIDSPANVYRPRTAYIKDTKSSGTAGGTFTSGSYQTRDLNTISGDESFVSVSSNQFTLDPGTYQIEASAPASVVTEHRIKLRNTTDSTDEILGTNEYTDTDEAMATRSHLSGEISISSQKTFEIQHRCSATRATQGFGWPLSYGEDEVYTQVKITKIL